MRSLLKHIVHDEECRHEAYEMILALIVVATLLIHEDKLGALGIVGVRGIRVVLTGLRG